MEDVSELRPSNYVRAALTNQYNVILITGAVSLAATLASWVPLVAGVVGEAVWLLVAPQLSAFRRHTDALEVARAPSEPPRPEMAPEYAERTAVVESLLAQVEQLCASRTDLAPTERQEIVRRLAPLLPSFLEICTTHQRLRRAATKVPLGDLQTEVASLHQALNNETDLGIRASLRRGLTVAERRIKQLEGNEAACRSLELALQNFQQSLALLAEATAGLATATEIGAEIESAASQLNRQAAIDAERELELTATRLTMSPQATN
jgi:HAMP domain-containing protein